jgi:putative transcriptional regulator
MSSGRASHLKRIRIMAGLTQQAVADRARLSRRTVMRVEAGVQRPSLETASAIATALNTDVAAAFPTSDFTLAQHHDRTSNLTGPERLAAFGSLPQAQQDEAMRNLAEQTEAEREVD